MAHQAFSISITLIEHALKRGRAGAALVRWGADKQRKAGGLLTLARSQINDVGDLRLLCNGKITALTGSLPAETPVEIHE